MLQGVIKHVGRNTTLLPNECPQEIIEREQLFNILETFHLRCRVAFCSLVGIITSHAHNPKTLVGVVFVDSVLNESVCVRLCVFLFWAEHAAVTPFLWFPACASKTNSYLAQSQYENVSFSLNNVVTVRERRRFHNNNNNKEKKTVGRSIRVKSSL